ncbi:MAG: helix-turn-helix transcriptional regulator [Flavobacteriales bacterium]|nr:helix-turn-helix transcriptional regulator [Flavobacteriales bacterium]|tara:strand:+ start:713 stop:940 length:228 start_codon:yes stop_codon:yes gene_type:complete
MEATLEKIDLAIKIGENIKKIRSTKGLNQSQLAKACGMDRQHMEKIENAKVSANIYTLYVISEALKVKMAELVNV